MLNNCSRPSEVCRPVFWVTQPCSEVNDACGGKCEDYGVQLYCPSDGDCSLPGMQRGISNENWLRGLMYNILFTKGKDTTPGCVKSFGNSGGHWSDSFQSRSSGASYMYQKHYGTVAEARADLAFKLKQDLSKLIDYGVAKTIDVAVDYTGDNGFQANITVGTTEGDFVDVGLTGYRSYGIIAF